MAPRHRRRIRGAVAAAVAALNYNGAGVPITPAPSDNLFDPPPFYRGQPTTFEPGRHRDVFQAAFPRGSSLTWRLYGVGATGRTSPAATT